MPPLRAAAAAATLALLLPGLSRAAVAGDPITAVKREGPVVLDGQLDEPAWQAAPAFDGFVQSFPTEGAAPSQLTEVRVLYDDHDLYVGIIARDRDPGSILRPLGRRDSAPYSDALAVVVDPMRDGRLGYYFEITAAGVLSDSLIFANDQSSLAWDAVWEGIAAPAADGWTAELRIPLSVMRFTDAPVQTWGFGIKRIIGRSHEEFYTCLIPRGARGQISRLGSLVGLADMHPIPDLQVTPYLAARVAVRPQYSDDTHPRPRLADSIGDVGVDVKGSLGRSLALQATLNPDFGQVEADQIIQNLSTFEAFFPEKRPFFLQGMDLFEPIKQGGHDSPQQLFYSRRIGLDAPIVGAAKLTGRLGDTVQIGLLESVVDGAGTGPIDESRPPRQLHFDWAQPFRIGPRSSLPELAPAPRNFLVGVAKWQPVPSQTFGATLASSLPLGRLCNQAEVDAADAADVDPPARCSVLGGDAASLDWTARSEDKEWFVNAQAVTSRSEGGEPERTLADGTLMHRGDPGYGGFLAVGRNGGRGLRGEFNWQYESPKLELNATGFQRTQNEQFGRAFLLWVEPQGGGPFHQWDATVGTELAYTTDGRGLERWGQLWVNAEFQTRSFHWFGCVLASDLQAWDVREISETGDAYLRPTSNWGNCWIDTDGSKAVQLNVGVGYTRTVAAGPLKPFNSWGIGTTVRVRPHPRFETRLGVEYDENGWRARYVDDDPAGRHVFADLRAPLLSITLRQQVVLTPRLTLQGYAQLFTSYGHYRSFYLAPAGDTRIAFHDLTPVPGGAADVGIDQPDFREGALNVNVVLRWEYRAGSTLFLVYTRNQAELGHEDGWEPPGTLRPHQLATGPTTDTFLVKWTYFWNG